MFKRVALIVLDGVGAGELPDAAAYGDAGSHTLAHVMQSSHPRLPVLRSLGLFDLPGLHDFSSDPPSIGLYGRIAALSPGKDTTTGHWELAGCPLDRAFPTFPNGFPQTFIAAYEKAIGRCVLGNIAASGTEIIEELGPEHERTGCPIVYTSADSVFQVAAHVDVIPLDKLYRCCEIARETLTGDLAVARVIARPFRGAPGRYVRTPDRHDYSLPPPRDTMLDVLSRNGLDVIGVGKIPDIFAGHGVTQPVHVSGNDACSHAALEALAEGFRGLLFVNLVDFDTLYGHRRDPIGFGRALEASDTFLAQVLRTLGPSDLLMIAADHGCDPLHHGTDHTREHAPLLIYSPSIKAAALPAGLHFSDVSATILDNFGHTPLAGRSLLPLIHTSREL